MIDADSAEYGPVPAPFVAATRNTYPSLLVRPLIVAAFVAETP